PFDLALKNLKTSKSMVKLSPHAGASIREGLKELADGTLRSVPAAEAGADLRAAIEVEQRKETASGRKARHLAA
ncbi:MAG TPA: hypothetical protein VK786_03840, partial [bacterium]|nr:hypothetical protein [bacterium]